ncbi:hypothetical protein [Butyrivibrio sp. VCD2006]|uniref:hypothetical protein n=1 Tax=Butyrivibrio sp. VCD2006 TaxID=1280664 RepID=UPI0004106683|nr:hypothetical protein [Butyrivibrio sp. VCD2006]
MTLQEMMQEEFKQGLEQGEDRKLVKQICKKLTKGKDVKTIADELDEDIELVSGICDVAKDYAPEYDADKVYDAWKSK